MPDIVISEPMDVGAIDSLSADFDVLYDPDLVKNPDVLNTLVCDARAIIVRNQTQVRAALLDAAPNLQVVGRLGVGLDNIDMIECEQREIQVFPATGANTDSVAELVMGALFVMFRNAYMASEQVLNGQWPRLTLNGREIQGHTLGLIGFGAIARAVAKRAGAMGMKLCAFDPNVVDDDPVWAEFDVKPQTIDAVLKDADALSLHVPLIDQTRHMINDHAIEGMKDGAFILNTSRGGIVDELALVDALKSGKLAGAFLDVFETEPVQAGSHLVNVPGLIVSPHIGALTAESDARVGKLTADNVRRVLEQG
jgi:(S)-sulfolactate dehydrogenase